MTADPNNKSTEKNPVGHFMVAAGAVIELKETGKILLVQRNPNADWHPGEWEICYGRIDQYEDVEMGLKREIREELGLEDIVTVEILRVWHMFRGSQKAENELIGITYRCRTNTQNIRLSHEHVSYEWISPQKALTMIKNDGIKEDIQKYMDAHKN